MPGDRAAVGVPELDLEGRRAVVTGISRGIGLAVAQVLAEAGAQVAGYYLDETPAADVVDDLRAAGAGDPLVETLDGSRSELVEAFAERAVGHLGGIDIWVNNAARLLVKPFLETSDDDWRSLLAVNLDGYVFGCRAAARRMMGNGGGRIVNISSVVTFQPVADLTAYTAAKGAVTAMTRALALDLAPHGITVNCVAPGAIDTPLNAVAYTPEVRARYGERIALGRIAHPREVALPVLFLASDAASYITGSELVCDGGITINGSVGHGRTD